MRCTAAVFFERVSADRFVELNFKQKLMGFVDIGAPRTVFIELKHLVFLEHRSRIGKGNGAAHRSIILAIAINIFRLDGYSSITSAHRFIGLPDFVVISKPHILDEEGITESRTVLFDTVYTINPGEPIYLQ